MGNCKSSINLYDDYFIHNNKYNKVKILEEMKIELLLSNKIIINNQINEIINKYRDINENISLSILLYMINYIWLLKKDNLLIEMKNKLIKKRFYMKILHGTSINYTVKLEGILIITLKINIIVK